MTSGSNDLTVIIPTIGRSSLAAAVASVAAQSVPTGLVVEFDHERTGCGPTLNRAVGLVETDWVLALGDDDELTPDCAALVADNGAGADLIVFQMRYPDGRVLPTVTDPEQLSFGTVGASYAVRTWMARQIGWIDEPCTPTLAEDWEMIFAVRNLGHRVKVIPRVAYLVRPATV